MKHLLRKYEALASEYEAEVCDSYEAKHTRHSPCGEATLHERSSLHFSYTDRCASFAPQFIHEITKSTLHNAECFLKFRPLVEIISWSFSNTV